MEFSLQPSLENEQVRLSPLLVTDWNDLYSVAADPRIWEQHPNKDRWKEEAFRTFFEGAIQSKGAFKILDKTNGSIAGSTRIYHYDPERKSIFIGYTFYATRYWGKGTNLSVKAMMLDYLFQFVEQVHFHIGAENLRSQIAISRLGAEKSGEETVAYHGEKPHLNFIYTIRKEAWRDRTQGA